MTNVSWTQRVNPINHGKLSLHFWWKRGNSAVQTVQSLRLKSDLGLCSSLDFTLIGLHTVDKTSPPRVLGSVAPWTQPRTTKLL